jgi:hypothetical protein
VRTDVPATATTPPARGSSVSCKRIEDAIAARLDSVQEACKVKIILWVIGIIFIIGLLVVTGILKAIF